MGVIISVKVVKETYSMLSARDRGSTLNAQLMSLAKMVAKPHQTLIYTIIGAFYSFKNISVKANCKDSLHSPKLIL